MLKKCRCRFCSRKDKNSNNNFCAHCGAGFINGSPPQRNEIVAHFQVIPGVKTLSSPATLPVVIIWFLFIDIPLSLIEDLFKLVEWLPKDESGWTDKLMAQGQARKYQW